MDRGRPTSHLNSWKMGLFPRLSASDCGPSLHSFSSCSGQDGPRAIQVCLRRYAASAVASISARPRPLYLTESSSPCPSSSQRSERAAYVSIPVFALLRALGGFSVESWPCASLGVGTLFNGSLPESSLPWSIIVRKLENENPAC